jgi:hypothetical protein
MPLLVFKMAGWPLTFTRVAGATHCNVTHGCGLGPGTVNAHPAMV